MIKLFNEHLPIILDDFWFGEDRYFSPNVKTFNEKNGYKVKISVPGLTKEDIKIKIVDDLLSISYKKEEEQKDKHFIQSFNKSYYLDDDIDIEKIKAEVTNGVLEVELPFIKKKEKKRIIEIT